MQSLGYRFIALCALSGCAMVLAGQAARQVGSGTPVGPKSMIQAYTAEFKTTTEKTLANGMTVQHEISRLELRDSEGRTLTAQEVSLGGGSHYTAYFVHDPIARTDSNWTSNGKRANVSNFPAAPELGQSRPPCVAARTGRQAAPEMHVIKSENEDLGTQVFEGLEAKGTRITFTTPIGTIDNDEPLVRVTEIWRAYSVPLTVRQVSDDPQNGKTVTELAQFTSAEPDPASFQPPEGYEIVVQETHTAGCQL